VYAGAQLAAALSYLIAGPLVSLAGPRVAFIVAGAGALLGVVVLGPALRRSALPETVPPETMLQAGEAQL
jgi:MFS family permease